jgi:hypothetical protein
MEASTLRSTEDDSAKSRIHPNFLDLQILVAMTRIADSVAVQLSSIRRAFGLWHAISKPQLIRK